MNNNVIPLNARQNAETGAKGDRVTAVVPSSRPKVKPAVYTVAEVAELLQLSLGGVYAMVRSGEIPSKQMGGRWVIPKRRFHAWLDDMPEASTQDVAHAIATEGDA